MMLSNTDGPSLLLASEGGALVYCRITKVGFARMARSYGRLRNDLLGFYSCLSVISNGTPGLQTKSTSQRSLLLEIAGERQYL